MAILKRAFVITLGIFLIGSVGAEWQAPRPRGDTSSDDNGGGRRGSSGGAVISTPSRPASRGIERRNGSGGSSNRTTIIRNPNLPPNVRSHERVEITPSQYYWHRRDGRRYGHYYSHGVHWYGFYYGPSFYWARYFDDYWWHYDPFYARWLYWHDGYWWWREPGGAIYVYVDDRYYPYDTAPGGPPQLGTPAPGEKEIGGAWTSPDRRRMVQVAGANADAFLYDTSGPSPVFIKQLSNHVENVRFSGGADGKPSRILLEYRDNRFAMFTENGDPIDLDVPEEAPPPPADLPTTNPPDRH